jgi:hypothetical protein
MSAETVGTIELSGSSRLVFTVSWWKGRQYANVRKHVDSARYSGPTKSGLAMLGGVLLGLVECLGRLRAEVPGAEQMTFARLPKGGHSEIVISVIPPDDLKGLPSVDIREYVNSSGYQGPTKKGVRFAWDKLPEFITILDSQARQMGASEKAQPTLFPEARPTWVKAAAEAGQGKPAARDAVLAEHVPQGPKEFPAEFVNGKVASEKLNLPTEPVSVVQLPTGDYVVQSDFGFRHPVRNPTEGNFIVYAFLRGHRHVQIPKQMIDIFKAVKAYENYLRDLRHALLQAYERKSGHRPMAEHQAKQVFASLGLPWL